MKKKNRDEINKNEEENRIEVKEGKKNLWVNELWNE